MKITYGKVVPWMAALCCLTLANGPKAAADDTASTKETHTYKTVKTETTSTTAAPAKCNKASSLIGMDVKNQNGEQLGHIKDLVFDLKTELVSYAVMSTSPKALLAINEKLLAVPLKAFTTSSDEKYLILNADKAKVEAAAGFDKNNWPNIGSTSWGAEPFWRTTEGKAAPVVPSPDATTPLHEK